MKAKTLGAALLLSSTLAAAALAASPALAAGALAPGNYSLGGIQPICLLSNGTWYGERFANWGGRWSAGPASEDATLIYGTYQGGFGNDTMIVGSNGALDWTEFLDNGKLVKFVDSKVTEIQGACGRPAARINGQPNPTD